ncbi:MAG: AAA family ATPase, partial [Clostridia bacterium]|nr:AAA family ATPase [Clostridia bacterium]
MPSGDDVFMRDLIDWAAPVDPEGTWELSGVVDHVIYANEETGYHVLELLCGSQTVTVVGEIPQVYEGEKLCAVGKFVFHRSHGRQFSVENVRRELPDNRDDIMRYLMSGAVKGIGPVLAERIFDTFGDEALYILENDPMMVAEVKGVSRAKALKIAEELTKLFDLRRMMIFLAEYGLRPSESMRVVNTLGDRTMMMVEENPYILCCYAIGLDFGRVDALAQERGFSYDNRERVEAGVTHVLRHNLGNGHTCLPTDKLLAAASSLLRCEPDSTEDALQRLLDREDVIAEEFGERQYIFLSECHRAERCIAETIRMMHLRSGSRPVSDGEIDDLERTIGITYEQYQRQAIRTALTSGVTIITGGPGTGKTTILNAVMQLFTRRGKSVSLAAPTGRAAKRMSEVTGCEATTIHRLLESEHSNDEGYVNFKRNAQNPLTADVVIIDEASMCDIFLTEALLSAMKLSATLVLVGDADQLPAVGAGSVMRDL